MNQYYPQQAVSLMGRFSVDGTPTDPDEVTLTVLKPDRQVQVYKFSEDAIQKAGVGVFRKDVVADQVGIWSYRYEGEGVRAADEGAFEVIKSRIPPS